MKSQVLENIENLKFKEVLRLEPSSREMLRKVQACAINVQKLMWVSEGDVVIGSARWATSMPAWPGLRVQTR
ncbi:MAG: hypothetical protein GXO71_04090 [Caldiserica bacterium]|nr:hypothetical protein [Caldisericota bacterium]